MFEIVNKYTGELLPAYGIDNGKFVIGTREGFILGDIEEYWPRHLAPGVEDMAPSPEVETAQEYNATSEKDLKVLISAVRTGNVKLDMGDILTIRLLNGDEMSLIKVEETASTIRFDSKDCLGIMFPFNEYPQFLDTAYSLLPDVLKRHIVKAFRPVMNDLTCWRLKISTLFIPAQAEILPYEDCLGVNVGFNQLEWYTERSHRMRLSQKGGEPCWYWTGQSQSEFQDAELQCGINSNGNAGISDATISRYAPIGFYLKKA